MVVFVDYDRDAYDDALQHLPGEQGAVLPSHLVPDKSSLLSKPVTPVLDPVPVSAAAPSQGQDEPQTGHLECDSAAAPNDEQENPNVNSFSAALSCYPIVKEIARSVDLNTLHALSMTCRQFRANLMPFRQQLIKQTLRCENEYIETLSDLLGDRAAIPDSVKHVLRLMSQNTGSPGRLTSGKIGKCARDMVAECRRCSRVVCRNCSIKPPSNAMLKNRLRRLCTTCRTAPLACLLYPPHQAVAQSDPPSFTAPAFARTPCTCEEAVWLCQPCGQSLRSDDTTYRRVWTWRTRYSTYLGGGLGTGIGEGCQGVKCGRGEDCLAAQEIELEVDSQAEEWATSPFDHSHGHGHGHGHWASHNHGHVTPVKLDGRDGRDDEEPGYFRQEIVGIGGVVKQKSKKRVTVGACVDEHEDERETGKYLNREESGQHRSWCGWCWRVVPGQKDLQGQ